jgi:hypothetical protein
MLTIGEMVLFVDGENVETTVKNNKIDAEDHAVNGKNVTFTVETLFNIISQEQIKIEAAEFLLRSTSIELEGITKITGKTDIIGATTVTGAATIAGNMAVSGAMAIGTGANGGVPLAGAVKDSINSLKDDINTLKDVFKNWVPVANDGGAALKAASSSWRNTALQPTQEEDISNDNFTH